MNVPMHAEFTHLLVVASQLRLSQHVPCPVPVHVPPSSTQKSPQLPENVSSHVKSNACCARCAVAPVSATLICTNGFLVELVWWQIVTFSSRSFLSEKPRFVSPQPTIKSPTSVRP